MNSQKKLIQHSIIMQDAHIHNNQLYVNSDKNSKGSKRSKSSNLEEEKNEIPKIQNLAVPDVKRNQSSLSGSCFEYQHKVIEQKQ